MHDHDPSAPIVRSLFSHLGERYARVLEQHDVAHVYNHWTVMPPLAEQHARTQAFTAPFTVLHLLTPRETKYHDAVKAYQPYDKLVKPLPEMRREAVDMVQKAIAQNRRSYVLVNNRSEGNAPLTVQALVDHLAHRRS